MRCSRLNLFQRQIALAKQIIWIIIFLILPLFIFGQERPAKKEEPVIALVGGTLIDGTGKAPIANAVIVSREKELKLPGWPTRLKFLKMPRSSMWLINGFCLASLIVISIWVIPITRFNILPTPTA